MEHDGSLMDDHGRMSSMEETLQQTPMMTSIQRSLTGDGHTNASLS